MDYHQIQLNMMTQQGIREAVEFQMRVFDFNYDFATDELKQADESTMI